VSQAALPFLECEFDRSVADRFTRVAEQLPDALAVKSGQIAWTYSDLDQVASKIARAIQKKAGMEPEPIALLFELDAPAIAAILGVLKSGNFYSALNRTYPFEYLSRIMEQLETRLLLVDRPNLDLAMKLVKPGCELVLFDDTQQTPGGYVSPDIPATTPVGIFFTSGSTGTPKGVIRSQRVAMQRVWLEGQVLVTNIADRQTLFTSLCFTSSHLDMMNALMNGCALCVYDLRKHTQVELSNWLKDEAITIFHPPIPYLRQFVNNLDEGEFFPSIRLVSLGGDVLFRSDIEKARRHFPDGCVYIHRLASSEVSTIALNRITAETQLPESIIPAGHIVTSREVSIVDDNGRPVPEGEVGLIAVRSRYLSSGYWRNPEETARRFQADPLDPEIRTFLSGDLGRFRPDGMLEFHGREDFMVKVRGYRVELVSIEAELLACDGIHDAVVIAFSSTTGMVEPIPQHAKTGADSIIAYLETEDISLVNAEIIRNTIAQKLPDYMLPSHFVFLDTLPRLPNGKINREALPDPFLADRSSPSKPDIKLETDAITPGGIVSIARSVTGVTTLGEEDDFFANGCNSLLAAQIVNWINQQFAVNLPLQILYEHPRSSQLARWLQDQSASPAGDGEPPGVVEWLDEDILDYLSQFA